MDKEEIKKILYTPIVAKIVTLSELKRDYTLKEFIDLMNTAGGIYKDNVPEI